MPGPASIVTQLVLLSPHRDDAAFSASFLLLAAAAAHLPSTLLNLFTRSAYAPFAPAPLSREATTALRLSEDQALLRAVGPSLALHDLDLLDAPLRLGIADDQVLNNPLPPPELAAEISRTAAALPSIPESALLALPLSLGNHIDHRVARDAALRVHPPGRLAFYQDLPYACRLSPEALAQETASLLATLEQTLDLPLTPFLLRFPSTEGEKHRLTSLYPSQISPQTITEIDHWTASLGGELLYLSPSSALALAHLLPHLTLSQALTTP